MTTKDKIIHTEFKVIDEDNNKNIKTMTTEQECIEQRERELELKGFNKGIQSGRKKIIEEINNLSNPYPLDIFPKVELSEFQSHTINDFLCSHLRVTLDGLSAELMRRARETCKLEILKTLGEKDGNL